MERAALAEILKQVQPALSTKDMIPVFTCFCFDGKTVTAFDDIIAIQAPCSFEVTGGVRGATLLAFLRASGAKEVTVTEGKEELVFKLGAAKLTLPVVSPDDFVFSFPDDSKASSVPITGDLITSLEKALVSMGMDPSHPWRMGITLAFDEGKVWLYSSDNMTASRAQVAVKVPEKLVGKSVVMPPKMASLLPTMAKREKEGELWVTTKWLEARWQSGTRLFARAVDGVDVSQFEGLFEQMLPKGYMKKAIDLPKGIDRRLERALVVLENTPDKISTFQIEDDRLYMLTHSNLGEAKDVVACTGHDPVKVLCSPDLIKRGLVHCTRFLIVPGSSFVLLGDQFVHSIGLWDSES